MDDVETTILELPLGLGRLLTRHYREHHQGAVDVRHDLPFPVDGQREFRTTNGQALVSADGRFLFLHDACALVRIELASRDVAHFLPPPGWYFHGITERGGVLDIRLYDTGNQHQALARRCEDACFVAGMGPVVRGRFPSAYP